MVNLQKIWWRIDENGNARAYMSDGEVKINGIGRAIEGKFIYIGGDNTFHHKKIFQLL